MSKAAKSAPVCMCFNTRRISRERDYVVRQCQDCGDRQRILDPAPGAGVEKFCARKRIKKAYRAYCRDMPADAHPESVAVGLKDFVRNVARETREAGVWMRRKGF